MGANDLTQLCASLIDMKESLDRAITDAGGVALMSNGKLKVFSNLRNFQKEYKVYARDMNGKVIKKNDHLDVCGPRFALMSTEVRTGDRLAALVGGVVTEVVVDWVSTNVIKCGPLSFWKSTGEELLDGRSPDNLARLLTCTTIRKLRVRQRT